MPDAATDPTAIAPPSPRLLVVDADDRTRASIAGILEIRHRYQVVGTAGHAGAALDLVAAHHPDVIVIDPRLPDLPDGFALIRRIRSLHPAAHILALGWTPGLEHDALAAGADGFIRKTLKPGDLSGAIERCRSPRSSPPDTGLIL
jgi:DNA-binding NarL/FixJ family response regulator